MISSSSTVPSGLSASSSNITSSCTFNPIIEPVLSVKEGNIQIGDDFTISVKELAVCIKYLRSLAMKEHPEDFI